MGAHGEGSIIWIAARGRWRVALQRNGRRLYREARTREEAVERLALLKLRSFRGSTDGLRAKERRLRAEGWIVRVLDHARSDGWDDATIAKVLSCQLSPRRIKRDIFGPCVYCETWLAATIDHVVPPALGGSDTAENLVSACNACNVRKGRRDGSAAVSMANRRSTHAATRFEDEAGHRPERTPGRSA